MCDSCRARFLVGIPLLRDFFARHPARRSRLLLLSSWPTPSSSTSAYIRRASRRSWQIVTRLPSGLHAASCDLLLNSIMLSSKVVWLALVSVIVVCGYPISGPPDALDQKFNYGEFVRNLEKKHRFSYNEIDEPLQPVLDDEEIELSLLAQPVSQPPSEDGFRASASRPIAPSKDSSEEDSDEYDEIRKVKKDPPAEEAPVKHETDDIKVALESDNEKESDSEEEAHSQEEKLPASDVAQESEVEAGSPESPQVENGNSDDVSSVQPDQTPVAASDPSEESASPVADAPVMSVSDEEPKGVQAVGPAQEEDSPSLDVAVKPEQSEPEVVLSELERVVASDAFESLDNLPSPAFEAEEDTKEVQAAESPVEDSPSTDFPVQFVPVESEASGDSAPPALDAQEVPKEVLAAEEAPSTDFPVQFVPQEDEVVVPVAPSENGEGSGSLVADTLKEEEKTSDLSLDGLEGSGFVADAQPEKHSVVNDGEEGSGAADPVIISDEGSGFFADPEKAGVLAEEGSGASNEPSEELKVSAPIVDETGDVAVAAVEADGSGDADSALDAPHADQTVESDKPSLHEEAHSSPVEDHVEQSDVSPIKEEAKVEEAADGAEKYIPVEVIVETEGQLNTEEKVNEPEVTESSLEADTNDRPSGDSAVLPGALPAEDNTESVLADQPSVMENLPERVAEDTPEQPQQILQSDELISATEEPQQSSTLL